MEVLAYGVEVTEEEKAFLRLPKSATDYAKIDEERLKTSIQVTAAKLRMSLQEQEEGAARGLDVEEEEAGNWNIELARPQRVGIRGGHNLHEEVRIVKFRRW